MRSAPRIRFPIKFARRGSLGKIPCGPVAARFSGTLSMGSDLDAEHFSRDIACGQQVAAVRGATDHTRWQLTANRRGRERKGRPGRRREPRPGRAPCALAADRSGRCAALHHRGPLPFVRNPPCTSKDIQGRRRTQRKTSCVSKKSNKLASCQVMEASTAQDASVRSAEELGRPARST